MSRESEIIYLYVFKKLSIPDISILLWISRSTVRYWLNKSGQCRSRTEGVNLAKNKLGKHALGKKRNFTSEWKQNISKSKKGKGKGVSKKKTGYVVITIGKNKGALQHRVIVEKKIGRKLKKGEVVHHDNEIKDDNNIDNLKIMSPSDHGRHHAFLRIKKGINFDISSLDQKKENHPMAKLTQKQVDQIRIKFVPYTKGLKQELADEFGVSKSCIKHIISFKNWK